MKTNKHFKDNKRPAHSRPAEGRYVIPTCDLAEQCPAERYYAGCPLICDWVLLNAFTDEILDVVGPNELELI